MRITYEVFQENDSPERWTAEAIDFSNGGVPYTAIFVGTGAERRARDYAEWMNAWQPEEMTAQ